jgi:hypothetical protein
LSEVECWAGRYEAAAALASESYRIAVRCESESLRFRAVHRVALVHAYRGDVEAARNAGREADDLVQGEGDLHAAVASAWVHTFLELSVGNPQAAIDRGRPLAGVIVECDVVEPGPTFSLVPDLIEALVSVCDLVQAAFYLGAFEAHAERAGTSGPLPRWLVLTL